MLTPTTKLKDNPHTKITATHVSVNELKSKTMSRTSTIIRGTITEKEENVCHRCQKRMKKWLTSLVNQETTNISVEILLHAHQTGKYWEGGISKY